MTEKANFMKQEFKRGVFTSNFKQSIDEIESDCNCIYISTCIVNTLKFILLADTYYYSHYYYSLCYARMC